MFAFSGLFAATGECSELVPVSKLHRVQRVGCRFRSGWAGEIRVERSQTGAMGAPSWMACDGDMYGVAMKRWLVALVLVVAACGGSDDRVAELEAEVAGLQEEIAATTTTTSTTTTVPELVDMLALWMSAGWVDVPADELFRLQAEAAFQGVDVDVTADQIQEATGGPDHVEVRMSGGGLLNISELEEPLDAFEFPSGTFARMGRTRALDGVQEAASIGGEYTASWTFHPDTGMALLIERNE